MTTIHEGPYRTQPPVPPPPPPTPGYAIFAALAVVWSAFGSLAMIYTSHHPAYNGRGDEFMQYAAMTFPSGILGLLIFFRLLSLESTRRPQGIILAIAAMCMTAAGWTGSVLLHTSAPYYSAHGRRHRRGRSSKNLLPEHAASDAWANAAASVDMPADARAVVAAEWRENARKEHASIAAFSQLALDLMAVGAPPHLLLAAQRDAADEVRHAAECYAIARSIDGVALSPAPFPEARAQKFFPKARNEALAQIAIDALMDGVLSEGTAARILARVSSTCTFPEIAVKLRQLAADESRHAKDSWDVIAWCLAEGGDEVASRVETARKRMPAVLTSSLPEEAKRGAWECWGIQGAELENDAFSKTRAHAEQKLQEMLRPRSATSHAA